MSGIPEETLVFLITPPAQPLRLLLLTFPTRETCVGLQPSFCSPSCTFFSTFSSCTILLMWNFDLNLKRVNLEWSHSVQTLSCTLKSFTQTGTFEPWENSVCFTFTSSPSLVCWYFFVVVSPPVLTLWFHDIFVVLWSKLWVQIGETPLNVNISLPLWNTIVLQSLRGCSPDS